jgi:uncharacterized protein YqeY
LAETNLQQKINADLTAAMKGKDAFAVNVLRFAKSFIDSAAKEKKAPLSDEEVARVLHRRIKQSQDAIEQFQQGQREDLAVSERREIEMLQRYLPDQLSEAELEELVEKAIAEAGATGPKDFGKVMGKAMSAVAGRADGRSVKAAIEKKLTGTA